MKDEIKKRIAALEENSKKLKEEYDKIPTILVENQGAIRELKKLIKDNKP